MQNDVRNDSPTTFTTWGPVRGSCGHRHHSEHAADRCVDADRRAVRRAHGPNAYSDRDVYPSDSTPVRVSNF